MSGFKEINSFEVAVKGLSPASRAGRVLDESLNPVVFLGPDLLLNKKKTPYFLVINYFKSEFNALTQGQVGLVGAQVDFGSVG